MYKVSIIVPAYNAKPYIEQCAASVLPQTLKDIETIFIDDGSSDKTGEILDRLSFDYPNVKVIHQENRGLYRSREIGLSLATGDYIGWVDADDFVEPNMYEVLYNTAIEHDSELVICDYFWFPEKPRIKRKWFREYKETVDVTFIEQNSQLWNKIVKRDLLSRLDIGSLFASCLDEAYIRVLMEARNPVTIKQPLYNYRVGRGTMSTSYKDVAHYRNFVEASKELRKVMRTQVIQPEDSYWIDYFDFRVAYYLLATMVVAANADNKDAYEQSYEELRSLMPAYNKNQHFWRILKENFGRLRAVALGGVVPMNYALARRIGKRSFR